MKQLSATCILIAAAITAAFPTTSLAQCCDDYGFSEHYFSSPCSANTCRAIHKRPLLHSSFKNVFHLTGLQPQLSAGDMPGHMPYQTQQHYYYFRPYQARQSNYNSGFEVTIREALGATYEQQESRIRQTVAEVDPLEYAILPAQDY